MKMVLDYVAHTKTYLSRIMLDNMVVPQANGDIDISMLKEAVDLINGRLETEVVSNIDIDVVTVLLVVVDGASTCPRSQSTFIIESKYPLNHNTLPP